MVDSHEGVKIDFDSFWQNCGLGSVRLWLMVYQIILNADYSIADRQQGGVQRLLATYCFLSFRYFQIRFRALTMSFINLATNTISAGAD